MPQGFVTPEEFYKDCAAAFEKAVIANGMTVPEALERWANEWNKAIQQDMVEERL